MSTTTHFDLPLLTANQDQPEVTVNEAMVLIDEALYDAGGSIAVKEVGNSPAGDASNVKALHFVGATVESLTGGVALITIDASSGSDTSSDVESLPAGGTTGQALVKSSGADYAVQWATVSAGGGGGGAISPDTHPASPTTRDDEFEGTTLASRWAWVNQGGAVASFANSAGYLRLTPDTTSTAEIQAIVQPIGSASTWQFRMKSAQYFQGNYNNGGFVLQESGTGKLIRFIIYDNSGPNFDVTSYSSPTSQVSDMASGALTIPYFLGSVGWLYHSLTLTGGNYVWGVSLTGLEGTFQTLYTGSVTAYFTAGADHIGICAESQSGSNPENFYVDWFRDYTNGYAPAASSSGASGSTVINAPISPDTYPASPSARDDEFEGPSLASKWAWVNQSTTVAAFNNGCIEFSGIADGYIHAIEQNISGAFTITAKVGIAAASTGSGTGVGLYIGNSTSGKNYIYMLDTANGPLGCYAFNSTSSYNATIFSSNMPIGSIDLADWIYLRAVSDGTSLSFFASLTGVEGSFLQISTSVALSAFITAIDRVGLVFNNNVSGGVGYADWFRDYTNGYAPATGNAGVSGSGLWSPDTPPASPDAMDDEFNGTSLDPKWSLFNGSGTGVSTAFANGAITISIPADGGAGTRVWRGISQPLPAGTWRFRAKVRSVVMGTTYNFLGFIIADSVSKHAFSYGIDWHSSYGEPCFFSGASSDYTGHTTSDAQNAVGSALRPFGSDAVASHYLEVAYDGTNYTLGASFDGINFGTVLSTAASTVGVTSPNLIILGGESISTTGCSITADYFRRRA